MVIYLCICLLVHSFVLACLQLFIYAFYLFQNHRWTWQPVTIIYLFILFVCLFHFLFVRSFVQSINQSCRHAFIYLFYLFVRSFVCSFVQSINQSINQSIIYAGMHLFIYFKITMELDSQWMHFHCMEKSNEFWAICLEVSFKIHLDSSSIWAGVTLLFTDVLYLHQRRHSIIYFQSNRL